MKSDAVSVTRVLAVGLLLVGAAWGQESTHRPETAAPESGPAMGAQVRPKPASTGKEPARPVSPKQSRAVQKLFRFKNEINVEDVAKLLRVFPVSVSTVRYLSTLAVSGTPEAIAAVEEVVRQIDTPQPSSHPSVLKNIEFVAHLLLAQHDAASGLEPLPAELGPVVDQLKGVLTYKSYGLLDTTLIRTRETSVATASGTIRPLGQGNHSGSYTLKLTVGYVRVDEPGPLIGVESVDLHAVMFQGTKADGSPASVNNADVKTSLDFREGQKVVVGKATIDGNGSALILVLSARIAK